MMMILQSTGSMEKVLRSNHPQIYPHTHTPAVMKGENEGRKKLKGNFQPLMPRSIPMTATSILMTSFFASFTTFTMMMMVRKQDNQQN
jgi:ABC-type uncharacterized transport system fused permease/ATPase subunit